MADEVIYEIKERDRLHHIKPAGEAERHRPANASAALGRLPRRRQEP
ncbi:MAG: hypothetical protein CM1200mP27_06370 [Chloroflexota bacterium]|nr:MAG: hypothetical protein CM1200mP27_06370 [Chloroflexota bacterium]